MLKVNKLVIKIYYTDNKGNTKSISPVLEFKDGVNFIWDKGKNSVGKSTCINSIFYALGIEELLGAKGSNTMKPVLNRKIELDDIEYIVQETYIFLEISNGKENVTIRRAVKGLKYDTKLIRIYKSKIIQMNKEVSYEDYFVHDSGAAQKDIGFHSFLERFIGINLPIVSYNNDRTGKLYLQAIANLFFIEQVKGWTGFNVQKVYYGIKNVEKISIEYILGCDITDVDEKRNNYKIQLKEEKDKWKWTNEKIKERLLTLGDEIEGVHEKYNNFDGDDIENIRVSGKSINQIKKEFIDRIDDINRLKSKSINENIDYIYNDLSEYEIELDNNQRSVEELRNQYSIKKVYHENLEGQLKEIELKIRRYEDIVKLRKLGSDKQFSFLKSRCPVCDNKLQESLLPKEINVDIMSNEENLLFIKDEKKIIEVAISDCKNSLSEFDRMIKLKEIEINELRNKIRIARRDLVEVDKLPSEDIIGKKYLYKEKFNKVVDVENDVEKYWSELKVLYDKINQIDKNIKDLPSSGLSEIDQKKIYKFKNNFRRLLKTFGYSSTNVESINLSEERYAPVSDGFHLMYDSAGSDFIRAVWAYLISLYMTAKGKGNHPGILIFDEPFQQQVSESARVEFINVLRSMGGQTIIATSLQKDEMEKLLNDETNLITINNTFIELSN